MFLPVILRAPLRHIRRASFVLASGLTAAMPGLAGAETVTVFAAASLSNALEAIEPGFEAATGHDLVVSLAGSSALARQIQLGAPADIFISANAGWMDTLEAEGLLEPGSRFDLLANSLVLVAADSDPESEPDGDPTVIGADLPLAALLRGGRLAMALVDAVPAGTYGKAALETLGLWPSVAGQVAQADNVRAALAFVATGEAPYGIVYATDAVAERRVRVVGTFPADSHPPIVYPVADLANRDGPAEDAFLTYLRGAQARAAFEAQGFTVLVP